MKALEGIDFTLYAASTIVYGGVVGKWISQQPFKFVKKFF